MSNGIDYASMRNLEIEFSGLSGTDNIYTFYYDETNNSRKFRITENDFNASKDEDFVIGGLVYEGKPREFDIEDLLNTFKLQPNVKEIKRRHIAPGNTFLECVNSTKLESLLNWIIDNKIYIHFMAMNNLYFGVVDIVDSLTDDTELTGLPWKYVTLMKNALYKYINADIEYIHEVFLQYGYPNISNDKVYAFCETLVDWIENVETENEQDDFGLESVRQLLKSSRRKQSLCFLTDNEDLMLMDGYESLYIQPIYMFPNSQHFFDEETEIIEKISRIPILLDGVELSNYSFVKSDTDRLVQFSDVIVGLLGKLFLYANSASEDDIRKQCSTLNDKQQNNILLLNSLIEASSDKCLAFIHYTANYVEIEKCKLILSAGK